MSRFKIIHLLALLVLTIDFKLSAALKDVHIKFPHTVAEGDDVKLQCHYDLEGVPLYAVKWFKGQREFFRYTPSENPPSKEFMIPDHLRINITASSAETVQLLKVSQEVLGKYTCEVTTDAPFFLIQTDTKKLIFGNTDDINNSATDKRIEIIIPKYVNRSDTVKLLCSYKNENSSLVSVEWKKNDKLFYKYVSGGPLNLQLKKLPGLDFSVKQTSDSTEITLENVTPDAEDVYNCQVNYPEYEASASDFLLIRQSITNPIQINIPKLVMTGESVKLKCQYNLNNKKLYFLKWFKGNREFYSYQPGEKQTATVTLIDGIDSVVDLTENTEYKSFLSEILIKPATYETAGKYRCEVRPYGEYSPLSASENLSIMRLPSGDPTIFTENDYLQAGQILRARCASPPSYPIATIIWLLNGVQVKGDDFHDESHGMFGFPQPSSSSLFLRMGSDDFFNGTAKLTCISSILDYYRKEKTVNLERNYSDNIIYEQSAMSGGQFGAVSTYLTVIIAVIINVIIKFIIAEYM